MGSLRNRIASVIAGRPIKAENSMTLPQQFLRYGNRGVMTPDWSQVVMDDRDLYTGYMYAAIRNRANRVAQLATDNIRTDAVGKVLADAKAKKQEVVHPYLDKIDASPTFSNYGFWYAISTYLDLEGVYYLMAVRTVASGRVGNVQEFKLLSPFNVKPVRAKDQLEIEGYREQRGGFSRDIPKEMIVPIRDFNPFSDTDPFSLADASKDAVFTLKQTGNYTRSTLRNNIKSSGIVSTGIEMNPEQLANFKARIMGGVEGEPIFTDGAGNVTWNPMQIDMDKAALDKISTMNLEHILAASGMSKTTLGIEVSGVTRDTSKVQSDLLVTGQVMPRLQLIIDALNQDYKVNYQTDWSRNKYRIYLDSPLGTDRDAEAKDIDIRSQSYDLYVTLVNEGYDRELAAKFAAGEIVLEDLGEPANPPKQPLVLDPTRVSVTETLDPSAAADPNAAPGAAPAVGDKGAKQAHLPAVTNALDPSQQTALASAESSLRNTVVRLEEQVTMAVINRATRNEYSSQGDVIDAADRARAEQELEAALIVYYSTLVPLCAASTIRRRMSELGLPAEFTLTAEIRQGIEAVSRKASFSHVGTILEDLLAAVRQASLAGVNQTELVAAIRHEYTQISAHRASVIAKTETNRAFSMAQFEADRQFLGQNNLMEKGYKKWICRGPAPCVFCLAKQSEPPIPFERPFASVGDVVSANVTDADGNVTVRKYPITYEDVQSGDIHPNGNCGYQLIIE